MNDRPQLDITFAASGHDCEILADENFIQAKYSRNTFFDVIRRKWTNLIIVDEKFCKSCDTHLKSHGAIEQEIQRHVRYHLHTIHPYSKLKIFWNMFLMFTCLVQLFVIPFDIAFFNHSNARNVFTSNIFLSFRIFLDLLFCVDMAITATTGYYEEKEKKIMLKRSTIIKHYLFTKFLRDFVISVPTHFDLFINMREEDGSANYYLIGLQMFSLLKIFRCITFAELLEQFCNIFDISYYKHYGLFITFTIFFYWHIISQTQTFFFTALIAEDVSRYGNVSFFRGLAMSYYDGSLLMNCVSFGDREGDSNGQYLILILFWVSSKMLHIFLLAKTMEVFRASSSPALKYSLMLRQLTEFLRYKQLPLFIQKRIRRYYEYHFQEKYFNERAISAAISGQLRQDILLQSCSRLVENVSFFQNIPSILLVRIVTCLTPEVYLTNDMICKANTVGNCMYFIASGTVAVFTPSGKEVCHLQDGAHFGEVALVCSERLRIASVLAVETCEVYRFSRKDFVKAVHPYPDLLEKIQKVADDRTEKTKAEDEHYKKELEYARMNM